MTNSAPLLYAESDERIGPDEQETIEDLRQTLLTISQKVLEDSGHALRSVHAKGHGLIRAQFVVDDHLTPDLAQGIAAAPATYPAVIRLSTPPGDVLPDDVSTPRGFALKIAGVQGERLDGSADDSVQDFVLVNGPAFLTPDAKAFLRNLKLLAATTDRGEGLKQALSLVLRGSEKLLEALGGESGKLKAMGGHPMTHILGETFFSQAPIRWGRHVAKVCVVPVSPSLLAVADETLDLRHDEDGLRHAVERFFAQWSAEWELRVQLRTDTDAMPIEDASVVWPEALSAYRPVARIVAPVQSTWNGDSPALENQLSFSPWNGIADHRPLGGVMRARRVAYAASAEFRGVHNGCPMHQPRPKDQAFQASSSSAR